MYNERLLSLQLFLPFEFQWVAGDTFMHRKLYKIRTESYKILK